MPPVLFQRRVCLLLGPNVLAQEGYGVKRNDGPGPTTGECGGGDDEYLGYTSSKYGGSDGVSEGRPVVLAIVTTRRAMMILISLVKTATEGTTAISDLIVMAMNRCVTVFWFLTVALGPTKQVYDGAGDDCPGSVSRGCDVACSGRKLHMRAALHGESAE